MNKEKVMQALRLASKKLSDSYEDLDYSGYIEYQKSIENEVNVAIDKLNSKPVMPKVFDKWYKDVIESYGGTDTRKTLAVAFNTLLTVESSIYDESESSLKDWFVESDSIEDLDRISKCIDAIRYGYEVEK